jgi:MerR family transcriptional regulator, heat shock protein HspR
MARSTSTFSHTKAETGALELFEPLPNAVYTIDFAARLADLPRRTVLVCCKYGLVAPVVDDDAAGGYYFNSDAIHVLRRVAVLRDVCGNDLAGIKIILDLTNALERLEAQLQAMPEDQPRSKSKSERAAMAKTIHLEA